ncbi:hypothetical protein [Pseudomonas sp. Leaf48]|uniref:hypothetical protein n=1 Tax=Pseudomonas sp. Leaf48 TaxID=1736221 RepID=UPI0012E968AC|nr:hypothetical protein [Pseudomonas sp. Leaf48]
MFEALGEFEKVDHWMSVFSAILLRLTNLYTANFQRRVFSMSLKRSIRVHDTHLVLCPAERAQFTGNLQWVAAQVIDSMLRNYGQGTPVGTAEGGDLLNLFISNVDDAKRSCE